MEGKKGFVLYTNKKYLLEALTDEQAGILFKHIYNYVNDKYNEQEEDNIQDAVVKMAWLSFKADLKEDLQKWKNICNRNSQNIQKRWQNQNTKNTSGINGIPKIPNDTKNTDIDIDIDSVIDKDIDIDIKEKEVKKEKSPTSRFIPPTLEDIKNYCIERNNLVDAERFYDFYSSKGWYVGKNKMKDWKAAIRTWEKEAGFKNDKPHFGGFQMLGETDEEYEKRTGIKRYKPNNRNFDDPDGFGGNTL